MGFRIPHKRSPKEQDYFNQLQKRGLRIPYETLPKDQDWNPNPLDFVVNLNNQFRHFTFTKDDYLAAGINIDKPITDGYTLNVFHMLCSVLHPEELFIPDDLLLEYVNRPNIKPFLRLYDWCHPNLTKPSDSPCLQSLAQALEDNQPEKYYCDPQSINTHWSHWQQ